MISSLTRTALTASAITAAAGILAAGLALRPAFAIGGAAQVGPFTVTHCTSSSPCQTYSNQGMGVGVEGVNSSKSVNGFGVEGNATGGGDGVVGKATSNIGVLGASASSDGVYGQSSTGSGLYGETSSGTAIYGLAYGGTGLFAESEDGNGGYFESLQNGAGLVAQAYGGAAIEAAAASSSPALEAFGDTGEAIYAQANLSNGEAIEAINTGSGGPAILASGALLGEVDESGQDPWTSADVSGNVGDYTDVDGDIFYSGSLFGFSRTRNGMVAMAYTPKSTTPTIEDDGTARLVDGMAIVALDAAFADSIDTSRPYHVMLTPDGETNGLYVASKSPTEFVVRELHDGRGTLDFDYHIYGSRLGQGGERMAEMTPAQFRATEPHVPATTMNTTRPKIHAPQR